jgi:hypothetical protein
LARSSPSGGDSQLASTLSLHRLYRLALLREPGGFESFLSCPVLAAPRNLPVSERVEGGVGQIRLDATQLGSAADSDDSDDVVLARVDQLDLLAREIVEGVLPLWPGSRCRPPGTRTMYPGRRG